VKRQTSAFGGLFKICRDAGTAPVTDGVIYVSRSRLGYNSVHYEPSHNVACS